jgi:ribonuclease HI
VTDSSATCIVTCDASFKSGSAGLGITMSWGRKQYLPKEVPRRGKTPPHAELLAVERGLREALNLGVSKVLIRSDSQWAMDVLNWKKVAQKSHILAILSRIWELEARFDECSYEWIPREQNRQSDKASKTARKKAEEREARRRAAKALLVQRAMARAANVLTAQEGGRWLAKDGSSPWFEVDLENMTCGCYWYTERWSRVNLAGRKKNMSPCKHMAAVAQVTGFTFV